MRDLADGYQRGLVLLDMTDIVLARDVLCRQHAHYAGQLFCLSGIDTQHAGARVLTAHGAAAAHSVHINVVRVFAVSLHLFGGVDAQ